MNCIKIHLATLCLLAFNSYLIAQTPFNPEEKKQLKEWVKEAKKSKELDTDKLDRFWEIQADLSGGSTDANHIYNYGRAIADMVQPGFRINGHTFSNGAIQLMVQAELAYRYAIGHCECHGRANIMLGMLYNQQEKYFISEPYLEKGLQLEEGSPDWMIAANQYLLAGAYTYRAKDEKYQKVYQLFKNYAPESGNAYYSKMAAMYIPYYEQ